MKRLRGLYKRGNVWWTAIMVNGKLFRESTKTSDTKQAEAILLRRRTDIADGKVPGPARNYTFKELAKEYLVWAVRQKSFNSKKYLVQELVEVFGDYSLASLSPRPIEEWQSLKLQSNKPATCNRFLATLKHMLTKAVEWEMVAEEASKKVHKVKFLPENNRRLRYLSQEECQDLIGACSPHLRPIVITALNTGMRKGEILGLKWSQIDLKHGFVLLADTKNNERREIPINATLRTTLEAIPHGLESEYVFVDRNGKPFQGVKRSFATACMKANITDFKFHDLRHTFASQLVMGGVDLVTVKELLGHKTLTMTLRYAHLAPSHQVKAVGTLDKNNDGLHNFFTVEHERS